jgi:hypothetical protein
MSLGRTLAEELGRATGPGTVVAEHEGAKAEADIVDTDRLGARITEVRVKRREGFGIAEEATRLSKRIRSLPERLIPSEVDPGLGGAILRSDPDEMNGGEFFELELGSAGDARLRRQKVTPGMDREKADFVLTHGQLGRLVDELDGK